MVWQITPFASREGGKPTDSWGEQAGTVLLVHFTENRPGSGLQSQQPQEDPGTKAQVSQPLPAHCPL